MSVNRNTDSSTIDRLSNVQLTRMTSLAWMDPSNIISITAEASRDYIVYLVTFKSYDNTMYTARHRYSFFVEFRKTIQSQLPELCINCAFPEKSILDVFKAHGIIDESIEARRSALEKVTDSIFTTFLVYNMYHL